MFETKEEWYEGTSLVRKPIAVHDGKKLDDPTFVKIQELTLLDWAKRNDVVVNKIVIHKSFFQPGSIVLYGRQKERRIERNKGSSEVET